MKAWLFTIVITFFVIMRPATLARAELAKPDEALTVAKNWMKFIVERDGHWAGEKAPKIKQFSEFRRNDMMLAYYASVEPKGYMIISFLKDFIPIKAYSTTSDLDPNKNVGMCALLKNVLESRNRFLIHRFGGIDEMSLKTLHRHTPETNRLSWDYLFKGDSLYKQKLESLSQWSIGKVGPLLTTRWGQGEPYNDDCPDDNCGGNFNDNVKVGCVALGMAQVMKFFDWPPFYDGPYDWPNMLDQYFWDPSNTWFNDPGDNPVTQQNIDAVAYLCWDALRVLGGTSMGCNSTGAHMCNWYYHDARDAFEDNFYLGSPECLERDSYTPDDWEGKIHNEIDHNRPMLFRIANSDESFDHMVVVDGYDNTGHVHANYGWHGDDHDNFWYGYDYFDCDTAPGYQGGCEWTKYEMVRHIHPDNGLCESYWGTLGPWGGPNSLHHYIYCDVTSTNLIVQGGARIQFLPGTSLKCSSNSIEIFGKTPGETRLFSEGLPNRGLKVASGGKVKFYPKGKITLLPLGTPRYLSASAVSSFQINLAWEQGYGNPDGFEIERKTGSGNYAYHTVVGESFFADTGLTPQQRYCYRIRAVTQGGLQSYPKEICHTTP